MTENIQYSGELRSDVVRELADIHASLKVLSAGQEEICRRIDDDIKSRLDKVNGSIAILYNRTEENKEALLNHVIDCPQKEKIEQIDRMVGGHFAACSATEAQSSKWKEKLLFPLIRIAVTGLVLILLYHAQEILKKL
jgi:hypothetical protein